MITAVLFDLDDTLVDRDASMRWSLAEQYDHFRTALAAIPKEDYVEKLIDYQNHGYINPRIAYERFFATRTVRGLSIQDLNDDIRTRYGGKTVLFDGVEEVLACLADKYRLAIITNGRIDWQYRKIRESKIEKYFYNVTISEEVACAKPESGIFLECLKKIDRRPEECVFIGDNPETDIKPAVELGLKTIWKYNSIFEEPNYAHGVVRTFGEVPCVISKIEKPVRK